LSWDRAMEWNVPTARRRSTSDLHEGRIRAFNSAAASRVNVTAHNRPLSWAVS